MSKLQSHNMFNEQDFPGFHRNDRVCFSAGLSLSTVQNLSTEP